MRASRSRAVYPVTLQPQRPACVPARRLRPALLALSMAAAFASLPIASQNLPVMSGNVVGKAVPVTNGNQMTVTTTNGAANHSATNWQSFSVGTGYGVRIEQPNAASMSINRVVTATPSQIYGTLSSNGKLVLVNQAGITVGQGAVVDTAGFTASVLGMTEADAAAGRLRFNADGFGNASGVLRVEGNIIARGGDVVLIAPSVEVARTGVVEAPNGTAILAAGQRVEVTGRGLEGIVLQVQAPSDKAVNLGTLRGDAVGIFASQLRHSGIIQASGASVDGAGRVVLRAGDVAEITGRIEAQRTQVAAGGLVTHGGEVTVSARYAAVTGAIDASGQTGGSVTLNADAVLQAAPISVAGVTAGGIVLVRGNQSVVQTAETVITADASAGQGGQVTVQAGETGTVLTSATVSAGGGGDGGNGGTVKILGGTVRLQGAQLKADGDTDGGNILVGGGRRGNDPLVPNSQYLYINSASALSASSRRKGNGGDVVLWSDGTTRFFGGIAARGAGEGGNGGQVEVSGKEAVQFGGLVDAAGGPGGANGTLLLDPKNITIGAAPGQLGVMELADPNNEASGAGDFGYYVIDLQGNRVLVTDPYDNAGGTGAGAIYVFDKSSGALVTALTGSHAGDAVGGYRQQVGTSYVFQSSSWNASVGAWTWISDATGASLPASGIVSSANSLVGTAASDLSGASIITGTGVRNLFIAPNYGGGKGAVATFTGAGFAGTLDSGTALMGSSTSDHVGNYGSSYVTGNYYAIYSPSWSSTSGALTLVDTSQALSGTISSANSLVGSASGDYVGSDTSNSIRFFSNGKVLVSNSSWGSYKGAWSIFDSVPLIKGVVSATTALVGAATGDGAGTTVRNCDLSGFCAYYVQADYFLLSNPNANGGAGSVTLLSKDLVSGAYPVGVISASNSLVGSGTGHIGSGGVSFASGGGSIYVYSPSYSSSNGALTFINLATASYALSGTVGPANSVVGTAANDFAGSSIRTDYQSGKLLLVAPNYGGGAGAMAVLSPGAIGTLDYNNALVGTSATDHVGSGGLTVTSDNYYWILKSPQWSASRGAISIFEPGSAPVGYVSGSANSWVGTNSGDQVGADMTFTQFANHDAVVVNRRFGASTPSTATGPGAITLITDPAMAYGTISSANSLVGTLSTDGAGMTVQGFSTTGYGTGTVSDTSNIVVSNAAWNDYRGFVTLIRQGQTLVTSPGLISNLNSLVGTTGGGVSAGDRVGSSIMAVYGASSGTLIIRSPYWAGGTGAYTFGNLGTGTLAAGDLGGANSLIGTAVGDLALSSATLYTNQYDYTGTTTAINSIAAGHAVLVAPDYLGGKGAIVNIDLSNPLKGILDGTKALVGGTTSDHIGNGGVRALNNSTGNGMLVFSPSLNTGAGGVTALATGAASFVGTLTAGNSFLGANANDGVGASASSTVFELDNGRLIFVTPAYAGGKGAVTLLDASGVAGNIGVGNSLVGSTVGDFSGWSLLRYNLNGSTVYYGNYAYLALPQWTNIASTASSAGALLNIIGTAATPAPTGIIGTGNALVGTHGGDQVGNNLSSNINISSDGTSIFMPSWNAGAGLLTFTVTGAAIAGNVDAPTAGANSVLGTAAGDFYNYELVNGTTGRRTLIASNYGGGSGAVFNVNIASGFASGTLDSNNALVGASTSDHVGSSGYYGFGNNGLVIGSSTWGNSAGALTLSDANGIFATGIVGSGNSLVGANAWDRVGANVYDAVEQDNGKLVVLSRYWGSGSTTASSGKGAITLLQSPYQAHGVIDATNSLVGTVVGDGAGYQYQNVYDTASGGYNHVVLYNQNYNGGRGMVTAVDATSASSPHGTINETNALVGTNTTDHVGQYVDINPGYGGSLADYSNYVVRSPSWSSGSGAITTASVLAPVTGFVNSANSLVGSQAGDMLGSGSLSRSNSSAPLYYTTSTTLGGNRGGVVFIQRLNATGMISPANTVLGTSTAGGSVNVVQDGAGLMRAIFSAGSGKIVYIDPAGLGSAGGSTGALTGGGLAFGDAAGSDVTISPQTITALTNNGTQVHLQANNDILVNAAITTQSATNNAGTLILEAGRSILLNANITTGGGDLGLIANSSGANAAYRDAGVGGITTAPGVTLSLGGGGLLGLVQAGAGSAPGGTIYLGQVNGASTMLLRNLSGTENAGIAQQPGTTWDTQVLGMETTGNNGAVGTLLQPITFNGMGMVVKTANAPANIHHTGAQLYLDVPEEDSPSPQGQELVADPGYRGIDLGGVGSLSLTSDGDLYLMPFGSTDLGIRAKNIDIETAGSIYVSAGAGKAAIKASGQLLLDAGHDILVSGGSAAGSRAMVFSEGSATLRAGGAVAIHGGSGNGAYALIDPTLPNSTMDVTAQSMSLAGGTGSGAYAALVSTGGPLTLNVAQLTLTPGSGAGADAVIIAPNAQALNTAYGGSYGGFTNPLDNATTDSGFYAVVATSTTQITQQFQADANFISNFLDNYNDSLIAQRRKNKGGDIVVEETCK